MAARWTASCHLRRCRRFSRASPAFRGALAEAAHVDVPVFLLACTDAGGPLAAGQVEGVIEECAFRRIGPARSAEAGAGGRSPRGRNPCAPMRRRDAGVAVEVGNTLWSAGIETEAEFLVHRAARGQVAAAGATPTFATTPRRPARVGPAGPYDSSASRFIAAGSPRPDPRRSRRVAGSNECRQDQRRGQPNRDIPVTPRWANRRSQAVWRHLGTSAGAPAGFAPPDLWHGPPGDRKPGSRGAAGPDWSCSRVGLAVWVRPVWRPSSMMSSPGRSVWSRRNGTSGRLV
jgi:hypothetical protein